jgi:hypothetical protein
MDTKKALETIVQGVMIANKRGAFELAESKVIAEAVEVFTKQDGKSGNTETAEGETEEAVQESGEKASS